MRKTVIILSIFTLIVSSCGQTTRKQTETESDIQNFQDTIIVKQRNTVRKSDSTWISKSYSYYWIAGKDTLNFAINLSEYKRSGEFGLDVRRYYREPMLFPDVLEKIKACIPLIEEDFDISKLTTLVFNEPIFYLDLITKLSNEYQQEFGRKSVDFRVFNQFLLKSNLTPEFNNLLVLLNKKVRIYGFEKFHIIEKKDYEHFLPNTDFSDYPEFTFNAHAGIGVSLENRQ